jgi:hypothetical protein
MACPYFVPERVLGPGAWTPPPRLPLIEAYSGSCHLAGSGEAVPSEDHQRDVCNCGYARGRCEHFPADARMEAVRFAVVAQDGDRVTLMYIFEKEHAPLEWGRLEFSGGEVFCADEVLARQAKVFLESWQRVTARPKSYTCT